MLVEPNDRTIDELIAELDKQRERYYNAENKRQRDVREKQMYVAIARLDAKVMEAGEWLLDNFEKGKDETWLDVLDKYQRGVTSLRREMPPSLPSPSQWQERVMSLSKPTQQASLSPNWPNG